MVRAEQFASIGFNCDGCDVYDVKSQIPNQNLPERVVTNPLFI
ncbi:MAG: hypothetical protein WEA79_10500 [Balneolaceae bacterium]